MSSDIQTLTDLKDLRGAAQAVQPAAEAREPKIDEFGRSYATGRRKNAVARVWIKPGTGKVTVNGREGAIYFARPVLRMMIAQILLRRLKGCPYCGTPFL